MQRDSFTDFVLEQLEAHDPGIISVRRMFGSLGLYRDNAFFGISHKGHLYLRTDDETRDAYLHYGMEPFRPSATQTLHNYYEVPVDVLEDGELLAAWVDAAVHARPT